MDKYTEIRPVVLGAIKRKNKLLVMKGYDNKKNEVFYRALGGGIEFGERSDVALKREFLEELGIFVEVEKYLGICENIFEFNGRRAHELVLMYEAKMNEEDFKEEYVVNDDLGEFLALWVDIDEFIDERKILYPKEMLRFIV